MSGRNHGGREDYSTSRGSSPARSPLVTSSTIPKTPNSELCYENRKKSATETFFSGNNHLTAAVPSGARKRSPLLGRRVIPHTSPDVGLSVSPLVSGGPSTPQQNRVRGYDEGTPQMLLEDGEMEASSGLSNGSGENSDHLRPANDDADGHISVAQRTKEAVDHLQAKIKDTMQKIREEQKAKEDNVNEYLKLAAKANAEQPQLARVKAVFEKKNKASAVTIAGLQKKLDVYNRRQREIETHGLPPTHLYHHRQPKEVLRDVGQGLKTVINKPKEIAHLIKNKFGSADNIKDLTAGENRDVNRTHHGSATLPPGSGLLPVAAIIATPTVHHHAAQVTSHQVGQTGPVGGIGGSSSGGHQGSKLGSDDGGSECNSSVTSESLPGGNASHFSPRTGRNQEIGYYNNPIVEQLLSALQERHEENARLREEIETIKQTMTTEVSSLREGLNEERFRCERLEEQVNDLTELHQNEMEILKTTMTDMEEKVQYQSEERIRDLHEVLENCQTRVSRMEHQQAQQQQQYLSLEGLDNSNARVLFVKLINVLLTVLQVLLLVVATVASILMPVLQTRTRLATTVGVVALCVMAYFNAGQLAEMVSGVARRVIAIVHRKSPVVEVEVESPS